MPRIPRVLGLGFRFTWALTGNGLLAFVVGAVWVLLVGFFVISTLLVAWPLLVAAVAGYWLASLRGWPPRRLFVVGLWSLPMFAVFILAFAIAYLTSPGADTGEAWAAFLLAPLDAVVRARGAIDELRVWDAAVFIAPTAIPVGLFLAWFAWRSRIAMMEAGVAGWSPAAPMVFDYRQWRRAARTALERVRAPGGVPLLSRRGNPMIGAVIRTVGYLPRPVLELGYGSLRTHMLIVGTTGAGKSTALVRLWAGFWAAAQRLYDRQREYWPWLVVIDAKGGFDGADTAERATAALRDVGAGERGRVAIWPSDVRLNLWALPKGRLVEVLVDLVPTAQQGAAAYYTDVLAAVVNLAIHAPAGPPANSSDFLRRLDQAWLELAYAGQPEHLAHIQAASRHLGDVALRFKTLMSRLGTGFDGDHDVTDFDMLYCVVEGTGQTAVAQVQARALVELVTDAATRWGQDTPDDRDTVEQRAGLLALDEFSAVAGRMRIYELTERCRSLGLAVQVAAQSWESLAPSEDERQRIAATAAGGVILMRTPNPQPICELAGTRPVVEVGKKLLEGGFGDEGTARLQHAWVVDPDRVRNFTAGQAAFIYGNNASYLHIAPYRITSQPHPTVSDTMDGPAPRPAPLPEQPAEPPSPIAPTRPTDLDDVFKPRDSTKDTLGGGGPR